MNNSHEFKMAEIFGPFIADGREGNVFRFMQVEPRLNSCDLLIFDFHGVENMTDSFANACFGNLVLNQPEQFEKKIRFKNLSDLVRDYIMTAVSLADQQRKDIPPFAIASGGF